MKRMMLVGAAAVLALSGCTKAVEGTGPSASRGRYSGVGLYAAGPMWAQVAKTSGTNAAAARLGDDEQVIVVIDSRTGELRQCGNLSGYCVAMNPWSAAASQQAPVALAKHADQLSQEAAAASGPKH